MSKVKVVMTAKGVVQNPSGKTQEIELRAERYVTEAEAKKYGDYTVGSGGRGSSQRSLQRHR
jgi:hypothetical protein